MTKLAEYRAKKLKEARRVNRVASKDSRRKTPRSSRLQEKIQSMVDKIDLNLNEAEKFLRRGKKAAFREAIDEVLDKVDSIEEEAEGADLPAEDIGEIASTVEDILEDAQALASQVGLEISLPEDEECGEEEDLEKESLLESFSKADKIAIKKLVEATKALNRAKKLFNEADEAGQLQQPLDDAAQATVDAAAVPQVSEDVKANIATIQGEIDELAQSVGITPVVDQAGDAAAGVPPVTDSPPPPAAPLQESISDIKKRIKERREKLNRDRSLKESDKKAIPEIIDAIIASTGIPNESVNIPGSTATKPDTDQIPQRGVQKDLAGDGKGLRWPNHPIADSKADLKGGVQEFKRQKVRESVDASEKGISDQHIEHFIQRSQLNFKTIFKDGILSV
jgi:hypothetical protein